MSGKCSRHFSDIGNGDSLENLAGDGGLAEFRKITAILRGIVKKYYKYNRISCQKAPRRYALPPARYKQIIYFISINRSSN